MVLLVMIFITAALIAMLIGGIKSYNEFLIGISVLSLFFVTLFGWILFGFGYPIRNEYKVIEDKVTILKSPTTVYVEYNGLKSFWVDAETYNKINDSTQFQIKISYNMYGGKCSKWIVIK